MELVLIGERTYLMGGSLCLGLSLFGESVFRTRLDISCGWVSVTGTSCNW